MRSCFSFLDGSLSQISRSESDTHMRLMHPQHKLRFARIAMSNSQNSCYQSNSSVLDRNRMDDMLTLISKKNGGPTKKQSHTTVQIRYNRRSSTATWNRCIMNFASLRRPALVNSFALCLKVSMLPNRICVWLCFSPNDYFHNRSIIEASKNKALQQPVTSLFSSIVNDAVTYVSPCLRSNEKLVPRSCHMKDNG